MKRIDEETFHALQFPTIDCDNTHSSYQPDFYIYKIPSGRIRSFSFIAWRIGSL